MMFRRTRFVIVTALVSVACAALWSRSAFASPDFPASIQHDLGLASIPPCTLCHANLNGGTGTVVTPFGLTMQDYGARGGDAASLTSALGRDDEDGVDSDGDGVDDWAELAAGEDPNDGPGRVVPFPRPEHGCSLAGRRHPDDSAWLDAVVVVLAMAWARRSREREAGVCCGRSVQR
jgi:hypothetical protein